MKKYKKAYGILHLAEKHTVFHLGKTKVHVSFTGGTVTKNGVTPATFTTDNPIVQLAIENSEDFKAGAITLISRYPVQGEVKIGKNEPSIEIKLAEPATDTSKIEPIRNAAPEPATDDRYEGYEEMPEPTPEVKAEEAVQEESAGDAQPTQEDSAESNLEVVEVSCKDVAKQYLQEHYGENPAPLRKIADVQECAAKYGITFNFV